MPLTGTGLLLGAAFAAAGGSVDGAGVGAWLRVGNVVASWVPSNVVVKPGKMVAGGGKVAGPGAFEVSGDPKAFGSKLADAAGSKDKAGIARWSDVGGALLDHLVKFGAATPVSFAADPQTGIVTGTGTAQFAAPLVALGPAAGSKNAPGIAAWSAVGAAWVTFATANIVVLATPKGFTSPPGGGPLAGSGSIQ